MKASSISRAATAAWLPLVMVAAPAPVTAQVAPTWRVVAGESASVVSPDLPVGTNRDFDNVSIGDAGRDLFQARVTWPSALVGYWAQHNGRFVHYSQTGTASARGPGRIGAEADHVFNTLYTDQGFAAPDGQRVFLAQAGTSTGTVLSHGLWRWDGTANIEIARGGTDGPLGPNLGTDWVFRNNTVLDGRMRNDGEALIYAEVDSPTGARSYVLGLHDPDSGNRTCMRQGDTDPSRAPGLMPGDSFGTLETDLSRFSIARSGRIHGRMTASGSRVGLWEFCDGPPRAIAATGEGGALGPGVGDAAARFTNFTSQAPQPASRDRLVFFADWRLPSQNERLGLFMHDGTGNPAIVWNEPTGFHGPNWNNATWSGFYTAKMSVAHDYVTFVADMNTGDGATPQGLFRMRIGERPQLVALRNLTNPAYRPDPDRTWASFDAMAVLSNGDILLSAETNPNSRRDLWLLREGVAPLRLLGNGTPISVRTPQGTVQTTITNFSITSFSGVPSGVRTAAGIDGWVGTDGTVSVLASTATHGRVLITTKLDVPNPDIIFVGDFE